MNDKCSFNDNNSNSNNNNNDNNAINNKEFPSLNVLNSLKDGEIPSLEPNWNEFKDFNKYVKEVEKYCYQYGGVKIKAPKGFHPCASDVTYRRVYDEHNMFIQNPIRQNPIGHDGIYQISNIEEDVAISVKNFEKKANELIERLSQRDRNAVAKDDYQYLERSFWKSIIFNPPLYGADTPGTLFDEETEAWNLRNLNTILDRVGDKIGGVNNPFMYFGQYKAMFPWHVEDMNLHSINYLHFGKPKQWYIIPPKDSDLFEACCLTFFPEHFDRCPEFLRHKTTLISPAHLKQFNIHVRKVIHFPGEFMITFPRSYHAGFNYGFNCAESINFATEKWLNIGQLANNCKCYDDTVRIDMSLFFDLKKDISSNEEKSHKSEVEIVATSPKNVITIQEDNVNDSNNIKLINGIHPEHYVRWTCHACTFYNRRNAKHCTICRRKRRLPKLKKTSKKHNLANENLSNQIQNLNNNNNINNNNDNNNNNNSNNNSTNSCVNDNKVILVDDSEMNSQIIDEKPQINEFYNSNKRNSKKLVKKSKKVVKKTSKNKSIKSKAINKKEKNKNNDKSIRNIYKTQFKVPEHEKKKIKQSEMTRPKIEWQCKRCTYLNPAMKATCSLCEAPKVCFHLQ